MRLFKASIPYNVNLGPQVIDKNQLIRLADFGARTQKYYRVPARTTYFKDPNVARDSSLIPLNYSTTAVSYIYP